MTDCSAKRVMRALRSAGGAAFSDSQERIFRMVGTRRTPKSARRMQNIATGDSGDPPMQQDREHGQDEEGKAGSDRAGKVCREVLGGDVGLGRDEIDHGGQDAEDQQESGEVVFARRIMQNPDPGGEGGDSRHHRLEEQGAEVDEARGGAVSAAEKLRHVFAGDRGQAHAARLPAMVTTQEI